MMHAKINKIFWKIKATFFKDKTAIQVANQIKNSKIIEKYDAPPCEKIVLINSLRRGIKKKSR